MSLKLTAYHFKRIFLEKPLRDAKLSKRPSALRIWWPMISQRSSTEYGILNKPSRNILAKQISKWRLREQMFLKIVSKTSLTEKQQFKYFVRTYAWPYYATHCVSKFVGMKKCLLISFREIKQDALISSNRSDFFNCFWESMKGADFMLLRRSFHYWWVVSISMYLFVSISTTECLSHSIEWINFFFWGWYSCLVSHINAYLKFFYLCWILWEPKHYCDFSTI